MPEGSWRVLSLVGENSLRDEFQPDLRIRDGAIVPAGKIIQSTDDYSLNELTLFVSLDADGNAQGQLYHDAGEGYGYQNGEYALIEFTASTSGDTVEISADKTEGNYPVEIGQLQIKLVTDDGVKIATGSYGEVIKIQP